MWVLFVRERRPDAAQWYGRRWLAAADALVWPLGWIWLVHRAAVPTGVVGQVVTGVAALCALSRLHGALFENHRYWFTTWKWGRLVLGMWVLGLAMKLAGPS